MDIPGVDSAHGYSTGSTNRTSGEVCEQVESEMKISPKKLKRTQIPKR